MIQAVTLNLCVCVACFPRDDLVRAIKKLKVMGNGFGMIPVGGSYLVQSVPAELNMDHTVVLQLAEVSRMQEKIYTSLLIQTGCACHLFVEKGLRDCE